MIVSKKEREKIKNWFGGKCAYCGVELGEEYHLDHIKPIRRNCLGDNNINHENDVSENLYPICIPCNLNKGGLSLENWRKKVAHYRDVQLIRDSHDARHLDGFGITDFNPEGVVFYFEKLANEDLL